MNLVEDFIAQSIVFLMREAKFYWRIPHSWNLVLQVKEHDFDDDNY